MLQTDNAILRRLLCRQRNIVEGDQFGQLTVLGPQFSVRDDNGLRVPMNVVRCACGTVRAVRSAGLANEKTKSCGCSRKLPTRLMATSSSEQDRLVLGIFAGRPIKRCEQCGVRVYYPCQACAIRAKLMPQRAA